MVTVEEVKKEAAKLGKLMQQELRRVGLADTKKFIVHGIMGKPDAMAFNYTDKAYDTKNEDLAKLVADKQVAVMLQPTGDYIVDYRTITQGESGNVWHLALSLNYQKKWLGEDYDLQLASDMYNWLVESKLPEFDAPSYATTTLQ